MKLMTVAVVVAVQASAFGLATRRPMPRIRQIHGPTSEYSTEKGAFEPPALTPEYLVKPWLGRQRVSHRRQAGAGFVVPPLRSGAVL